MFCWHAKNDSKLANKNCYEQEYTRTVEITSIFTLMADEKTETEEGISERLSLSLINLISTQMKLVIRFIASKIN